MIETKKLKIADLALNEGQVPGLPTNPRQWTREDLDKLKASIKETPELFEARGILVYPFEGKYVVLGGNMRLSAAKELKMKDVPCIILPENTPVDKLKELVIKDNGAFGAWDYDLLANEWDDLPLPDWGVPAWDAEKISPDEFDEGFSLPDGDKQPFTQVSFNLSDEQATVVKNAIADAQALEEFNYVESFGNTNRNGNALYLIIQQWAEQRK